MVVEVGPRDGLQIEKTPIPASLKIQFINALSEAGLPYIESGSFVSPKWVPQVSGLMQHACWRRHSLINRAQMANSEEVFEKIDRRPGVTYAALVPNAKGMQTALKVKAQEIAVFAAASESFSRKNINCSIEESLDRFKDVVSTAKDHGIPIRGYIVILQLGGSTLSSS